MPIPHLHTLAEGCHATPGGMGRSLLSTGIWNAPVPRTLIVTMLAFLRAHSFFRSMPGRLLFHVQIHKIVYLEKYHFKAGIMVAFLYGLFASLDIACVISL
ncbi:hypothetical protein [Massilia antarctica]|uniref:hypothetical protein n=1 Tax=Massilia antarctica TaxID=2765360 RepID=UPI001E3903A7|nr:hypothetical protein [Massilia antarctica]